MRTIGKLSGAFLFALVTFQAARGTTLSRLSLDHLAAGADAVAQVRCTSAESRWENGSIWTVTTAHVVETLKGTLPAEIPIRLPGGRAGHFTATVDGTPTFHPGDEAVLFLQRSPTGEYTVAGWVEGTFRISRDARTGSEIVTQDSSAFAVFDPSVRAFRSEGIRGMRIEEFRALLAASLARADAAARGKGKLP